MYEKFNDYQAQANEFNSGLFFEEFPLTEFVDALDTASDACEALDLYKRALVYDNREKYALDTGGDRFILDNDADKDLVHGIVGIVTETGEIGKALVGSLDKMRQTDATKLDIDRCNVKEELGDLLWYIALAARGAGVDMAKVAERNIEKLSARYPGKVFSTDRALNRDIAAERKILEAN